MEKGTIEIHSENILPIIKKWLYSDRDIFIRELISNACDAIKKVKILREEGEVTALDDDFRIDVKIDKEARTLTFSDNGIGMTSEEVKKYIAQIAFSGAEEFLSKYKSNEEKDQIIGHFGLGFYSAYMVADKVEINTLSYRQDAPPVLWICDGSSSYEIGEGSRATRGTDITLFIDAEHEDCLDTHHVDSILKQYCSFLPYPIYLGDKKINEHPPLWIKPPSECSDSDYLEFFHTLYPHEPDPLFWIHLNVDYPFHLKGILYFPKIKKDFDLNKSHVDLYCNRVFVSDNCKDLIPNYLAVLKGIIDSPDIPLNVSRSYLQMDKTVRQLGSHISKKVSDNLNLVYKTDRERFTKAWTDISTLIKLGVLEDDKFYERVKEILIWRNTQGEWTTLADYIERNKEKNNDKVYYTTDPTHAGHVLEIYQSHGIEVLSADNPLDPYLMQFLENKLSPVSFQRIDSEVHDQMLDKNQEDPALDDQGKTESSQLADFIKSKLTNSESIEIEAKYLAADHIPVLILIDEKQRRMKEYMERMSGGEAPLEGLFDKKKVVVNTNSGLIKAIKKLDEKNPELATELAQEVYELALLSQREMDITTLGDFVKRSNHLLEALAREVIK